VGMTSWRWIAPLSARTPHATANHPSGRARHPDGPLSCFCCCNPAVRPNYLRDPPRHKNPVMATFITPPIDSIFVYLRCTCNFFVANRYNAIYLFISTSRREKVRLGRKNDELVNLFLFIFLLIKPFYFKS